MPQDKDVLRNIESINDLNTIEILNVVNKIGNDESIEMYGIVITQKELTKVLNKKGF